MRTNLVVKAIFPWQSNTENPHLHDRFVSCRKSFQGTCHHHHIVLIIGAPEMNNPNRSTERTLISALPITAPLITQLDR
jgi:hypothetical protein